MLLENYITTEQIRYLKKWVKISGLTLAIVVTFVVIWNKYYYLRVNITTSLKGWVFLIDRHTVPTHKGQLFAFVPPPNPLYGQRYVFIKIVGGVAGDKITVKNRTVNINNIHLVAKKITEKGRKLYVVKPAILKKNEYFAYTPHSDSYDSRYKSIGIIHGSQIIGIAHRLF